MLRIAPRARDQKITYVNIGYIFSVFFTDSLMEQIPAMFGDTRETETILGPVIQAGKEAFKVRNN